jgi:hypothetical protein
VSTLFISAIFAVCSHLPSSGFRVRLIFASVSQPAFWLLYAKQVLCKLYCRPGLPSIVRRQ